MASINQPPDFVAVDGDKLFVFIDCMCEAASPDDCDCKDAMWFERVANRASPYPGSKNQP